MAETYNCTRVRFEILREIAYTDFDVAGGFVPVGAALAHPARAVIINNDTDKPLYASWNGVDRHMGIPAFTTMIVDIGSNMAAQAGVAEIPAYDRLWVKQKVVLEPPTVGYVDFSVMYLTNV